MKAALIALALLLVALAASPARAQGPVVNESSAQGVFPDGITFTLDAESATGFDEIRLVYQIAPDGVRATTDPDCTGGTAVRCTYDLAAGNRTPLIPGAEVTYFWRVTIGGERTDTAAQVVVYEDTRFDWQQISDGNVTLWWYEGSEEDARAVLAAGREALDRISALLQTSVDFPVKIRYYGSAQEMQAAIISDNQEGVITLGEVVYSDTAMVSADSAPLDIARHEIAHIVIREALRGPFNVPDWLNEGTAVYAQTEPLSSQRQALDAAIETGQVFSVRSISSASAGALGSRVALFYAQSWSLVDFLIATYGEEDFAALFQAFDEGASIDGALEQVYGFNQDGLENAWREHVGLPPREAPTPDGDALQEPPTEADPTPDVSSDEADGGSGSSTVVVIAIVALMVVLAAGLVVRGVTIVRRRR